MTPGRTAALVATGDAPDLISSGLFEDLRTYKEGPRASLIQLLQELDPRTIGINVSQDDALADGLTAGLRDHLVESLAGTTYASRLTSAEKLLALLRGIKLPGEHALVKRAVEETEGMFDRASREFRIGMKASEIADLFHREADRAQTPTAWSRRYCPTVAVGAKAAVGHVRPADETIQKGCIVHVDFGILRDQYCSDLQRMWYAVGRVEGSPSP